MQNIYFYLECVYNSNKILIKFGQHFIRFPPNFQNIHLKSNEIVAKPIARKVQQVHFDLGGFCNSLEQKDARFIIYKVSLLRHFGTKRFGFTNKRLYLRLTAATDRYFEIIMFLRKTQEKVKMKLLRYAKQEE